MTIAASSQLEVNDDVLQPVSLQAIADACAPDRCVPRKCVGCVGFDEDPAHCAACYAELYPRDQMPIVDEEIRYLGDVQRLELRPDDIIVLRLPDGRRISEADHVRMQAVAESYFPGHKIVILEGGMQIGIVSPTVLNGSR